MPRERLAPGVTKSAEFKAAAIEAGLDPNHLNYARNLLATRRINHGRGFTRIPPPTRDLLKYIGNPLPDLVALATNGASETIESSGSSPAISTTDANSNLNPIAVLDVSKVIVQEASTSQEEILPDYNPEIVDLLMLLEKTGDKLKKKNKQNNRGEFEPDSASITNGYETQISVFPFIPNDLGLRLKIDYYREQGGYGVTVSGLKIILYDDNIDIAEGGSDIHGDCNFKGEPIQSFSLLYPLSLNEKQRKLLAKAQNAVQVYLDTPEK